VSGRDWEPVARGATGLCSPACGRGCKRSERDRARAVAEKLAKRLGEGWVVRVWENLGWHSSVHSSCGRLKVSWHYWRDTRKTDYTAFLGEPEPHCSGRWASTADTPEDAIRKVYEAALAELNMIQTLTDGIEVPKRTRK
jgi:hypothetical protein